MENFLHETGKYLDESGLAAELASRSGLIPVHIDVSRQTVVWEDLNTYHCYEGFFHDSLRHFRMLQKVPPIRFVTDIRILGALGDSSRRLAPTAFIFHAGRCGSTLLARVLARSRSNMIFSEAGPHNQIWRILPDDDQESIHRYRSLILAMGRQRLDSHRAHIIKFSSFNTMHYPFIRRAFPGVPALFLFRDPAAILASFTRQSPAWLGKDLGRGLSWKTVESAVEDFFRSALTIGDTSFGCLNYAELTPTALPSILKFFGLDATPEDLSAMGAEFNWHSKTALKRIAYTGGVQPQYGQSPASLAALFRELLERASGNA